MIGFARRVGFAGMVLAPTFGFLMAVASGAAGLTAVPGQPVYDPAQWVLVANHLHSAPGGSNGWSSGVKHILTYCSARNIEFALMTDHNAIKTWFLPEFRVTGKTTPVGGMEWTSEQGHANLIGFTASTPEQAILPCGIRGQAPCAQEGQQDHASMVKQVHERGGLVIINHPVLKGYKWPAGTCGADAVEVNRSWSDRYGVAARQWWHDKLLKGDHITGFGGSDYHYFRPLSSSDEEEGLEESEHSNEASPLSPDIETPVNLVRVGEKTVAAVMDAVRAGHVQVLSDLTQPRVFLGCDANGDGVFDDYMMGDRVRLAEGSRVVIQVRVLGGKGQRLRVFDAKVGEMLSGRGPEVHDITSDDFVLALERTASAGKDRFLRTEVGERGANVTNPLYY